MLFNKLCNNKQGFTSMDTTWEELRQLNDHNSDVLSGSSFGDKAKPIYLSFQTSVMSALSIDPANAKQVDSIESMSKASYFHGNVWVTVSSAWDIYTAHQMPCLITIHGDKSK